MVSASTELDELIGKLREIVEDRHKSGLKAIDALVASLSGPALPPTPPNTNSTGNGSRPRTPKDNRSNIEKTETAIAETPHTTKEIAELTGLDKAQVRGALYNKLVQVRIKQRKIAKKMYYVSSKAADTLDALQAKIDGDATN